MTVTANMTPGPWSYALEADPHTARHVGYRIRFGDVVIAEAFIRPYQVAINEANARVLAAAPALLDALRWAVGMAEEAILVREQGDDPDDTDEIISMHRAELQAARNALAVATEAA